MYKINPLYKFIKENNNYFFCNLIEGTYGCTAWVGLNFKNIPYNYHHNVDSISINITKNGYKWHVAGRNLNTEEVLEFLNKEGKKYIIFNLDLFRGK